MTLDVAAFLKSGRDIELDGQPRAKTVVVVDASFNPPNLAHLKLAEIGLENYEGEVVFMLATGNADKASVAPELLQKRVDMVQLLIQDLKTSAHKAGLREPVAHFALTRSPLFIDKARALNAELPGTQAVFVVGFDTLERFFDQKYYKDPVEKVMREFFSQTSLLALTREPDARSFTRSITLSEQTEYAKYPGVKIVTAGEDTLGVNSSAARDAAAAHAKSALGRLVSPRVAQYILESELYNN